MRNALALFFVLVTQVACAQFFRLDADRAHAAWVAEADRVKVARAAEYERQLWFCRAVMRVC